MGFDQRLSAMPQCAIAQVESVAAIWENARMEAPNSKECSSATARLTLVATLVAHDVGKRTAPNCSCDAGAWAWS